MAVTCSLKESIYNNLQTAKQTVDYREYSEYSVQ